MSSATKRKAAAVAGLDVASEIAKAPKRKPAATPEIGPVELVPFAALQPSKLNPRTLFDPGKLAELSKSIALHGIQQNLVGRRGADGLVELVAGERRYRAFKMLVDEGRQEASDPLPVKIIKASDDQLRVLALVENLDRDDLHPLDEAEAYLGLRQTGKTAAEIAALVGKSKRHVELRLQLARNLAPEAKKALYKGEILLAAARTLAAYGDKGRQGQAVKRIKEGDWAYRTAADIKRQLLKDYKRAQDAFFPLSHYLGPRKEDEDSQDVWLTDVEQFNRLQAEAVTERAAEYAQTWAWCEVDRHDRLPTWNWKKSKNKKIAGVVIKVRNYRDEVEVIEGVLKPADTKKPDTPKIEPAPDPNDIGQLMPTKVGLVLTKQIKTRALRSALLAQPTGAMTAMALVILALRGRGRTVRLYHDTNGPSEDRIDGPPEMDEILAKMKERLKPHEEHDAGYFIDLKGSALGALLALPPEELAAYFTAFVARTLGSYPSYNPQLSDEPLAAAIADELGVDVSGQWQLDEAWLQTCRKPLLVAIAAKIVVTWRDIENPPPKPETLALEVPLAKLRKMKGKELIAAILKRQESADTTWLPFPFRFGSEEDLVKLAKEERPS